jgi:hypothetical protein
MSTFLEHWGNAERGARRLAVPTLDPAYLALAYNYEVGSGGGGTVATWLDYVVDKYGVVPEKSYPAAGNTFRWPERDWTSKHSALVDSKAAAVILEGSFANDNITIDFTGRRFLEDVVQIRLKDFTWFNSSYQEKFAGAAELPDKPPVFRNVRGESINDTMDRKLAKAGYDNRQSNRSPGEMYAAIKRQLDTEHPVLLSIIPGLINRPLSQYRVVEAREALVDVGKGQDGLHSVVAVGYCDHREPVAPICEAFEPELKLRDVEECLVIQNSWGPAAHEKGYFCLAGNAASRVIYRALIYRAS